jgi:hypothetical protein
MQLLNSTTRPDVPGLNQRPGNAALLVDPDPYLLETRQFLLSSFSKSITTVRVAWDVFRLQLKPEPQIVVLSDTLGSFQLREVAEHVRHRWPRARILVVGTAVPALEDPDYDETVTADSGPTEFLAAVARCIAIRCEQKLIATHTHDKTEYRLAKWETPATFSAQFLPRLQSQD